MSTILSSNNDLTSVIILHAISFTMGVSFQKVAGLSGVLKVALSNKNSGKLGQNLGKQSISPISIGWSAAAADAAGIHLIEGSSHGCCL